MKKLIRFLLIILTVVNAQAHPWKPSHYVIVDTDGGIDDMRALSMLLASHDVRVLAVTVSDGALSADDAYVKVRSMLDSYHHEGIKTGINRITGYKSPSFVQAKTARWGEESGLSSEGAPDCISLIREIITAEKNPVSFVLLGSPSTAWKALLSIEDLGKHIKDFIWSADGSDDRKGFNYNIDRTSSEKILKQEIPVKIIRGSGPSEFYNTALIGQIGSIKNPYAVKLSAHFSNREITGHRFALLATDEMVPLFLHYPGYFMVKTAYSVSDCTPADIDSLRLAFPLIIAGETVPENQVVKEIPQDPGFYMDDVTPFVTSIIERHGHDEWDAGVLANEMHRHLGVYATIGVKMGIRAREYFCAGVDEFRAISYAGYQQPLSCMNDGVLVSTGATPGHGLLTVIEAENPSASVDFIYLNRKIKITLKPEISNKISSELKEINFIYGLDSNIYWELVRKKAIEYWLTLDRHEIFIIEEL